MIIIVCLDDNNGMLFNNRRQSRDSVLIEHICRKLHGEKIFVSEYSASLFPDKSMLCVDNNLLEKAGEGDICFIEKESLADFENKIEKIIVYRWNRVYPSDKKFDISLNDPWKMVGSSDFPGHSHEKITEEVFDR